MRVVKDTDVPKTFHGVRVLEQRGDTKEAVTLYESLLEKSNDDLKIITRLIILYRKLKNYAKELNTINKAIRIHEQRNAPKKINKNVSLISKKTE